MPRDTIGLGVKQFMVDVRAIHNNKLIRTEGPFSESHAKRVKDRFENTHPWTYCDVRRMKEGESNE